MGLAVYCFVGNSYNGTISAMQRGRERLSYAGGCAGKRRMVLCGENDGSLSISGDFIADNRFCSSPNKSKIPMSGLVSVWAYYGSRFFVHRISMGRLPFGFGDTGHHCGVSHFLFWLSGICDLERGNECIKQKCQNWIGIGEEGS